VKPAMSKALSETRRRGSRKRNLGKSAMRVGGNEIYARTRSQDRERGFQTGKVNELGRGGGGGGGVGGWGWGKGCVGGGGGG